MTKRQLISDVCQGKVQHVRPCSDCPWSRPSLPGWLGTFTPEKWLQIVHGESQVQCHVIGNMQCAGSAIYRANVAKKPRHPEILVLPKDKVRVFATPMEFLAHHGKK